MTIIDVSQDAQYEHHGATAEGRKLCQPKLQGTEHRETSPGSLGRPGNESSFQAVKEVSEAEWFCLLVQTVYCIRHLYYFLQHAEIDVKQLQTVLSLFLQVPADPF